MAIGFTPYELHLAWERVRDNEGCAGVDGITIHRFSHDLPHRLKELCADLEAATYRPLPLLYVEVEKKPGEKATRRLLIPTVRDRIAQTAVARRLSLPFEDEALDSSFAYRPGRGVDRAVARIRALRDRGFTFVADADISSFFDKVPHSLLLSMLAANRTEPELLTLMRDWIEADYWDGRALVRLKLGIPQGSPLSPLLANFFLTEFDARYEKSRHHLVRYSDDFLILCDSEDGARQALKEAAEWLGSHHLELKPSKTRITSFKEGFHFLGVYFLEDRIYVAWKEPRQKGRVVYMAPKMPQSWLLRYEHEPPRGEMEQALRKAHVLAAGPRAAAGEPAGAGEWKGGPPVAFLYVVEQGAVIHKSGDRFRVEKDDRILFDQPYHKLEHVLVFGNVQLTTQTVAELLEKDVPVSFLSERGHYRGMLTTPRGGDVLLRKAQFALCGDGTRALALARDVVASKVHNACQVLVRYGRRGGTPGEALAQMSGEFGKAEEDAQAAPALEALLGIEGSVARRYFAGLMEHNISRFAWSGRKMHPSPDPLNALLSFTYTLLGQEVAALLEALGLDPYYGFLHQPDYGRPSLALDLLEPLRHPVGDRLVLTLANKAVFADDDFAAGSGNGLHLTPLALRLYVDFYEAWMLGAGGKQGWRRHLRSEVERFVYSLRHGEVWKPFRWDADNHVEEECSTLSATT